MRIKLILSIVLIMVGINGCGINNSDILQKKEDTTTTEQNIQEEDKERNIQSNNEADEDKTSDNTIKEEIKNFVLIDENVPPEHRYYSPDGKNYIRVVISPDEIVILKEVYLNQSNELIEIFYADSVNKSNDIPVFWLSHEEVLIYGQYIVNITTNTKKELPFVAFLKDGEYYNRYYYSLNSTGTKIVYSIFKSGNLEIFIYDINTDSQIKIGEYAYINSYYDICRIFWDKQDNVYYFSVIDEENRIMKYNTDTKESNIYLINHYLEGIIPNTNYMVVQSDEGTYKLIDLENGNDIFTTNYISGSFYWHSNGETFIYYDDETNKVVIFSIKDNQITKEIDMGEIDVDGEKLVYFDYIDENYTMLIDKLYDENLGNLYRISN